MGLFGSKEAKTPEQQNLQWNKILANAERYACNQDQKILQGIDEQQGCRLGCMEGMAMLSPNLYLEDMRLTMGEMRTFDPSAPIGSSKFYMFACSQTLQSRGLLGNINPQCNDIVIASVKSGTLTAPVAKYVLMANVTLQDVQRATLILHDLDATEENIAKQDWADIPGWNWMLEQLRQERVSCGLRDAVWLAQTLKGLYRRGYKGSVVSVLPAQRERLSRQYSDEALLEAHGYGDLERPEPEDYDSQAMAGEMAMEGEGEEEG